MKLWRPAGDIRLRSIDGRTLVVPVDPAGVEVPNDALGIAIFSGCLPVGAVFTNMLRSAPDQKVFPHVGRQATENTAQEYRDHARARTVVVSLSDPLVVRVERALAEAGDLGMSRTAMRDLFGRNQSASRIAAALKTLAAAGRARREIIKGEGRPQERWFAKPCRYLPVSATTEAATTEVTPAAR